MMRKQTVLFLTLSCFIVLQPVPGFTQVMSQASAHVHMSMNNPTMHFQHCDGYQHNSIVAPAHHYGEHQNNGTTLHHTHHYLWTHARDVQPDKQQQAQINLNLSSSNANLTVGHLLNGRTITIDVSGQQLSVTNNTLLTPGEYMAVIQIVHGGQQTILLNSLGETIGGTVVINLRLSNELSSLVVPQGVTVIDLTRAGTLNLTGNLTDDGSLYVTSTNHALNTVTVDASNINVQAQGLISDVLPSQTANLSLSLDAANNISNAGTIQAANNVNLVSGSGNITNTGLIASTNGNINIASPALANTINVNATGGTFQALNGAINMRDASYTGSANMTLTGGNWLSQQLNLNSGTGAVNANIGQVSGAVNTTASQEHFAADTNNLILGGIKVSGDPTYYNTGGPVTIATDLSFSGQALAIVASTNIITAMGVGVIDTSSSSGDGGAITMIAGASFMSTGAPAGSNDTTSTLTIHGASATGGYIDLNGSVSGSGQSISSLTSASSNSGSNGGNITLVAYAGSGASSGSITLPSALTVTSGGNGTGSNGNVTIIAGAASGTGINIGNIDTTGGTGSGGNISLLAQTPTINGASTMTILNGAITNSTTYTGGTNTAASISTQALTAPGVAITATTGGSIAINNDVNNNCPTANGNGGAVTLTATGSTSDITVGNIYADGGGTSGNGGTINISAGRNLTVTASSTLDTQTSTGTGGNINVAASTNSLNGVSILGDGAILYARPNDGNGGTITVTDNSQGTMIFAAGSGIDAGGGAGAGNGNGGTITITNLGAGGSNGGISFADGTYFSTISWLGPGTGGSITVNAGGSTPGIVNFAAGTNNIDFYTYGGSNNGIGNGGTVTITAAGFAGLSSNSVEIWAPGGFLSTGSNAGISGNGGTINLTTLSRTSTGDITAADFATGAVSPGNGLELWAYANGLVGNGGTLNISSGNNLTVPANASIILAPGLSGNGGNINLTASTASGNGALTYNSYNYASPSNAGPGTATGSSTAGSGTGNGGSVTLTNNSSGPIIIGTNIDVSGATTGSGGTIAINAGRGGISIASGMALTANGTNGGRINLLSVGVTTINSGVTVTANGTTGNGGMIELGSDPISGSFAVLNNGLIQATNNSNNSGIVGFNGGPIGSILLVGTGSVRAGRYVGFGYLDSNTLAVYDPRIFPPSFSLQYGLAYFIQGGGVFRDILITSRIPSFPSTATTLVTNQTKLYEQIGTRIATDYTPYTTYPRQPQQYPLQGGIQIGRLETSNQALFAASGFNANELNALSHQGIVFGSSSKDNFFDLVKGYVLFMPTNDIKVQTREGLVSIPKGAAAWIMETGHDVAIYDLHDTLHSGVIKVIANKKELILSPGTQVLLTRNSTASFDSLNPSSTIGYRNVKVSDLGDGIKAYVCDFSIAHGLTSVPVIHNLLDSPDPSQRKTARKMMKNAAILVDLTGSNYKTGSSAATQR